MDLSYLHDHLSHWQAASSKNRTRQMEGIFLSSPNPSGNPILRRPASSTPRSLVSRYSFDPTPRISSRPCSLAALIPTSSNRIRRTRRSGVSSCSLSPNSALRSEFDVVVVGAGIIGLTIARQFLLETNLSVAVVDARVPCSGATGAGQGYIWMTHKMPGSDIWDLGLRSKQLWEMLAQSIQNQGMDPLQELGWKKTGSLLIGRTLQEITTLEERVKQQSEAGLRAQFISGVDLQIKEPSLEVGKDCGAAFLPDDCQLDAHCTVSFLEKGNRFFISHGRYAEFFHDPIIAFLRSDQNGEVEAVQTSKNVLYSRKAVIIATGAWSGSLMQNLLKDTDIALNVPVKPRKGHLLVLENFHHIELKHGLMEFGYVDHQIAAPLTTPTSGMNNHEEGLTSISMTATTDKMGNLVLGSSRQFTGFNTEVEETILNRIWERAGVFFPALRELHLEDLMRHRKIRIGHRPYTPDGKPIIGPVPGLPRVFLATGHEGGGLCLALGTAEMVADTVLGNTGKVECAPFSLQARCYQ